uniref:Eukaryotic translation initiation factor 3 subunit B n=1 Tax=Noccaea caerulescens TaxID=107243 RepID=A0A1J3DUV0_NOCCA
MELWRNCWRWAQLGIHKKTYDEALYHDDQLEFDTGFGNIIVPVVPKSKFEKLEGVVKKIYNQLGVILVRGLWMPIRHWATVLSIFIPLRKHKSLGEDSGLQGGQGAYLCCKHVR